jgi:hypothetical protein
MLKYKMLTMIFISKADFICIINPIRNQIQTNMKRSLFTLAILTLLSLAGWGQNNVGINDDNSAAKASAMLDVYSTTKGLLIPRVALTSTTTAAPVTSPEASLLIYNTATTGDVSPGYYYWNGSTKWVRLTGSTDPQHLSNTVSKSANSTLLKTENMVFASGNITLTLPTVTSADDGLAIAIKNVGTYTDLITVIPEAGKAIDANSSSLLTRWQGKTYIAKGSSWILLEKEAHAENQLEVNASGSFTTIAEVVAFLNAHMTAPVVVELGAGTYSVAATQTINLAYPVTFKGISFGETTIAAAAGVSGTPLFTCATECYFKQLTFTAYANTSGNDAIRFTGSGTYNEVKDCYFSGFNRGVVATNNNEIWIFETDFDLCAGAGVEIAAGTASGGSIKLSECDFTQCAKGVNLLSAVAEIVSIINCTFYNKSGGSDIGILYTPATFTSFAAMYITNNAWNNQGTYISGFDFARSDGRDANAFLVNNAGKENENPHCKLNVNNNASSTTITNSGTYYKAVWSANTSVYTCKWTIGSTGPTSGNRILFQPNNGGDVWAVITGNISVNNSNRVITIAVVKNGITTTRYGETDLRVTTASQPFQFSTVIYIPDLAKNDYLELYCTSSSGGDVVVFQDLQWFANTQ